MNKEISIYEYMKDWFDFCFENPESINTNHSALYFFILSHSNRLGWKKKFGLPTTMSMEAIGIKSYNTYIKTFNELSSFGCITVIEKSKNQYSSNIIALSKFNKATIKALDKATLKHMSKQGESTIQSNCSIIIPSTNTPINEDTNTLEIFDFKKSLLSYGFDSKLVSEWMKVRKVKKSVNTETAFNGFIMEVQRSNKDPNIILQTCVERSWSGFKNEWLNNLNNTTNGKPRNQQTDEGLRSFLED